MANIKIEELTKDLTELRGFLEQSSRQRIKDFLTIEIRKLETELKHLQEASTGAGAPSAPTPSTGPKRFRVELTEYAFDQSDKFVKLYITLDSVQTCPETNVIVQFTEKSFSLLVQDLNNRDYVLEIKNLLGSIDASKSYRKIKTNMVVIYAKKVKEGTKWDELTSFQKRVADLRNASMDEFCKDEDASIKDNSDPTSGIMAAMKKMYETGDNEMKRMLSKAWVEGQEKNMAPSF